LFDMGVFAYSDNDYENALTNFNRALAFQPNNPFYIQYLGKTFLAMDQYQDALNMLTKAYQLNPTLYDLEFDIAMTHYKMKHFKQAGQLFIQIIENDLLNDHILEHFYAGICLFQQKQYTPALSYFKLASLKAPTIQDNCYFYMGMCYYYLNQYDNATYVLNQVILKTQSKELKANAQKWIQAINKQIQIKKPYHLFAKIGYQYNDNVTLVSPDLAVGDEDDTLLNCFFSGNYHIVNSPPYQFGFGYSHYQSIHQDKHDYDLTGSTLKLYAKYNLNPVSIQLQYMPSYYWLDDIKYMSFHKIQSQLTWPVTSNLMMKLAYTYGNNRYFQSEGRDGHSHSIDWISYYKMSFYNSKLFVGGSAEENHAAANDRKYDRLEAKMGLWVMFPKNIQGLMNIRLQSRHHKNNDSIYLLKRNDSTIGFSFDVTKDLPYKGIYTGLGYQYIHNNSTINNFDYRRNCVTLYFTIKWP